MTTSPKVKPLVAFVVAHADQMMLGTVSTMESVAKAAVGGANTCKWADIERAGYRIIKVRIEPVEE